MIRYPTVNQPRTTQSRIVLVALVLIALVALVLRTYDIENRPLHGDEGVNALKFAQLYHNGTFKYDPHEYHGPSLYYLTYPVMGLFGFPDYPETSVMMYRLVPALFAVGTILLLYFIRDALGTWPTIFAGLAVAVSPNLVFYGRYYIHEWVLVFFTMVMLVGLFRYLINPHWKHALTTGVGLGMMHTTKETCIIAWFALFVGCIYAWWVNRSGKSDGDGDATAAEDSGVSSNSASVKLHFNSHPLHCLLMFGVGITISVIFFSSFFSNWQGVIDSITTYEQYLTRAGGEGSHGQHDKPFEYYIQMLIYSKSGPGPAFTELPLLMLALVGGIGVFVKRLQVPGIRVLHQLLVVYTLVMILFYSAVAYKTPWCMLGFTHGLTFMAGLGAVVILNMCRGRLRPIGILLVTGLICWLAYETWYANFRFPIDRRNPYVYSNPQRSMLMIPEQAYKIAELHPAGNNMPILLIGADNWPLPFYLRELRKLQHVVEPPGAIDAPVVIAEPEYIDSLTPILGDGYFMQMKSLRPLERRAIYIRKDLWESFLEAQRPVK